MSDGVWLRTHRRSILFLLLLLTAGGLLAALRLPVGLFPQADFPRVVLTLDAGDRPADLMMLAVTQPAEEQVRRVPGVRDVRSTTSRGSAEISISFDWGSDMLASTTQVNQAVTQILPSLPAGTQLTTRRMDPTVFPILAYSLTSATLSQSALRDLAQFQLRPLLSSVNGVAHIDLAGGAQQEYLVSVNPERMVAVGMTLADVSQALAAANVVSAVGRIEDRYKLYLAVSDTQLKNVEDIRRVVLKSANDGLVRVGDLAEVTEDVAPQWIKVNADGRPAVLINIYQQPGSNSVRITQEIAQRLAQYKSQLPEGVAVANWYDQSQLVLDAASSVRDAILIGTLLALLVLLLFLRNLKITLIAALVVPAVLATTSILLYALGMSFNIMTLGGMAAAVGLVIDDAIVMVEHLVRRLRAQAAQPDGVVLAAAMEFARPLAGSSTATVVIFLPLAFLTGVSGAFFKALSLTMASALIISFFISWLAVPVLADRFLNARDAAQEEGGRLSARVQRLYTATMRRVLRSPLWLLVVLLPLLGAGAFAYSRVGSGFMPALDEGGFILDYRAPPGTSLTETDRLLRQVEAILRATPAIETYSRRTGLQLGGGITEANEGDFFIRLKSGERPPIEDVMDAVRRQVESDVPGLKCEFAQLMEDLIGDLTSVPQPIEIKLFSDRPDELKGVAETVVRGLGKIEGVVDTRDGINPAGDALEIHVDPERAAIEGVTADSVTQVLEADLTGLVSTQVRQGPKLVGVRVWIPRTGRAAIPDIARLLMRAPDSHLFALSRVATVAPLSGQPQITRQNLKRMVAVTARISGRSLGEVIADVRRLLAEPGLLPKGMYFELGGLYQQQQIAFQGLIAVFVAALGLIFVLLVYLYESFRMALAILIMPLLAVTGVFIGLWLTGIELNISAMMGMTMIIGMVTEVAIFYFSEFCELSKTLDLDAALIEAGSKRMRPIAMTTFAAILALLPLALALGRGSGMQQPLAVAIISGLVLQLPLILIVMPAVFRVLGGKAASGDALAVLRPAGVP